MGFGARRGQGWTTQGGRAGGLCCCCWWWCWWISFRAGERVVAVPVGRGGYVPFPSVAKEAGNARGRTGSSRIIPVVGSTKGWCGREGVLTVQVPPVSTGIFQGILDGHTNDLYVGPRERERERDPTSSSICRGTIGTRTSFYNGRLAGRAG